MTYTLAKQLKDAGFPVGEQGRWYDDHGNQFYPDNDDPDVLYFPTLSELIEACGNVEFELHNGEKATGDWGTWYAAGFKADDFYSVEGETPKEVVTKLWLALNSKQT